MIAFTKLALHLEHRTGGGGKEQVIQKAETVQRSAKHGDNYADGEPTCLDGSGKDCPVHIVKFVIIRIFLFTLFGLFVLFTEYKLFGHQRGNGHSSQP